MSHGVLSIEIDRDDITNVTLRGVPITPSFQLNGTLNFQLKNGGVVMNSDMCLKESEILPFIDALIAHNIIIQAEHQHFYDFEPLVWFVHFRASATPKSWRTGSRPRSTRPRPPSRRSRRPIRPRLCPRAKSA